MMERPNQCVLCNKYYQLYLLIRTCFIMYVFQRVRTFWFPQRHVKNVHEGEAKAVCFAINTTNCIYWSEHIPNLIIICRLWRIFTLKTPESTLNRQFKKVKSHKIKFKNLLRSHEWPVASNAKKWKEKKKMQSKKTKMQRNAKNEKKNAKNAKLCIG